ncbi:hypothetical protein [Streptomyces albidoflavus]|uniref:hypothetical protein n=1 Tax=Streptomyces albidoflavus TaxID=1886 RepID=UPI0033B0DA86
MRPEIIRPFEAGDLDQVVAVSLRAWAPVYASFADWMKGAGVRLVSIWTGGDPGHAPARRTYEKAGYTALPLVRYYQAL